MTETDIATRLDRLEAVEAIKQLKARYWYHCDQKDVESVRNCFADGAVVIDYDGPAGVLSHRDDLRALFQKIALREGHVELHHGGPPDIELEGDDSARGRWGLNYTVLDGSAKIATQIGGYYHDRYVRLAAVGGWRIKESRFRVCSALSLGYGKKDLRILFAGNKFGGRS